VKSATSRRPLRSNAACAVSTIAELATSSVCAPVSGSTRQSAVDALRER
jgi:hypothetical protein